MKPCIVIVCVLLFSQGFCHGESVRIIDEKNSYGGVTKEVTYSQADNIALKKAINYYADHSALMQSDVFPVDATIDETGIAKQTAYYDAFGNITQYDIFFSDDYYAVHGINRMIEDVDKDDNVTRMEWYIDDELVDFLDDVSIANRFPFYRLSFLTQEMFEDGEVTSDKDEIAISMKYRGIRTVVNCDGEIEPLTEEDRRIIWYLGNSLGNDDVVNHYSSKMLIDEDGDQYWMYIQNGLEQYLPKEEKTTIRYYLIGFNRELYAVLVVLTNL